MSKERKELLKFVEFHKELARDCIQKAELALFTAEANCIQYAKDYKDSDIINRSNDLFEIRSLIHKLANARLGKAQPCMYLAQKPS